MPKLTRMRLSEIDRGERRRRDMGDIASLAQSIAVVGMLHPPVVSLNRKLIAGARRLAAAVHLGREMIDVLMTDDLDDVHAALLAERDENTERKPFTPSEAVAMAEALKPYEEAAAKERQKAGVRPSVKLTEGSPNPVKTGDSGDRVAEAVGLSRATLAKAEAVVEAAREHPKAYAGIAEKMDDTGNVSGAYNELTEAAAKPRAPKVKLPHKPKADKPPAKPKAKPAPPAKPEPKPGDPKWAEWVGEVDGVLDEMEASFRKLRTLLDSNGAEKKCRHPFAKLVGYMGGPGAIKEGIDGVRDFLPAAPDSKPPGYVSRNELAQREKFHADRRKAS